MSEYIPDYRLEPPPPPNYPICPFCGSSLYDYLIFDRCNDIVGCTECVTYKTAEEYLEEMNDDEF